MKRILAILMVFIGYENLHSEAEYLFEQQYDDGCRVLPLLNLHKLERLTKKYGAQNLIDKTPWHEWNSRRESLGTFFPFYYEWVNAFNILNSNPNKYPHLRAFLVGMATDGPVFPHFYDKDGKISVNTSPDENGNEQIFIKYQIDTFPFSFFDYGAMFFPDTSLKNEFAKIQYFQIEQLQYQSPIIKTLLPFGKNKDSKDIKGDYVLYNSVTNAYDVVTVQNLPKSKLVEPCGYEYPVDIIKNVIMAKSTDLFVWQYKKYSKLNELGPLFMEQKSYSDFDGSCKIDYPLGFAEICHIKKIPLEIKVNTGEAYGSGVDIFGNNVGMTSFGPQDIGRTKLMFLRFGIDENNQEIDSKHPLYGAYTDFKNLCNSSKDNPWSDTYCKKENFLQYYIAAILKNNSELYMQLENALNALEVTTNEGWLRATHEKNIWNSYTIFLQEVEAGNVFRRKGSAYDIKKMAPYMLGKEQMLAYLAASVVRMLWYGVMNENSFKERTGFESFAEFKMLVQTKNVTTSKNEKVSFIDIWKIICKDLSGKNFFSLERHGWLISFDPQVIALQNKRLDSLGQETVKLIGCVGIESIYASEFKNSFYRRDRKANQIIRDEYARIRMVEELSEQLTTVMKFDVLKKSELQKLKDKNLTGIALSQDELKNLEQMENELKSYKKGAEHKQSKAASKIQKALREKKVDNFAKALKNITG